MGEEDDPELDQLLQQMDTVVAKWKKEKTRRPEKATSSASRAVSEVAEKVQDKKDRQPWQQSFCDPFVKPRFDRKPDDNVKAKSKGKGKGKTGRIDPTAPRFDLAKTIPRKEVASIQSVLNALD